MFFVSVLSVVLIPFDLQEWGARLLFALSAATGGLFLTLLSKMLNERLVS
jgi:hypothetical protein